MIELVIESAPPSLNRLMRYHWSKRVKVMDQWRRLIWAARCQVSGSPMVPLKKARITVERRSPGQLDKDNLYGSMKVVLDGLKNQQFIEDDSPDHIELTVTQIRGKARTTIQVEAA